MTRTAVCLALLAVLAVAGPVWAEEPAKLPFSYRPPENGAPARRMAAATRGAEGEVLDLAPLSPADHAGRTATAQPTLYWYQSRTVKEPVQVVIVSERRIEPLLEITLPGTPAGINHLSLAERKVSLPAGEDVDWSVAVVLDPTQRSKDVFATGRVRYEAPSAELAARLKKATPDQRLALHAEAGLWYDLLDGLSRQGQRPWRALLLDQAGLSAAAAWDRWTASPAAGR